jgi:hypothetical protein
MRQLPWNNPEVGSVYLTPGNSFEFAHFVRLKARHVLGRWLTGVLI